MATSNRKKKTVVSGITEQQYQEAMAAYAAADAKGAKIVAQLDTAVTNARAKYDPLITEQMERRDAAFEVIQAYCTENKATLFPKKKSIENTFGIIGFRTGTPKLKTLPRVTWAKVLEKAKSLLPDYVRTKEEVNKETLLADRNNEDVKLHLNEIGVYVDQDETFYIELKKEELAEA